MVVYGVKLIGINAHTGEKLIFSLVLFAAFMAVRFGIRALIELIFLDRRLHRLRFWARQVLNVVTTIIFVLGFLSIGSTTRAISRRRSASPRRDWRLRCNASSPRLQTTSSSCAVRS